MIDVDIARVVFVNANKYTIDLVSINGNQYQDVPFLSLYSKPSSTGQGIYMMPERDSYALIVKIKNDILGAERFAFGFFNPLNDSGGYSGDREEIRQGDFVAKTVFGNKIIGRTDGSITVKASDQSQFTIFPSSGNKEDSWGYDNLLRALFENVEINTDAGHIHQKVNKKEKTTNINFEVRNKPLYSEDPQIIRGNIGSQGVMGDSQFFKTLEVVDKINNGNSEVIRQKLEWKTDGHKHHIINDPDGNIVSEVTVTKEFDKNVKKYKDANLLYEMDLQADGTKTTTSYTGDSSEQKKSEYIMRSDGYFKKTIWNEPGQNDCYIHEVDERGNITETVKDVSGNQVLNKTIDNHGQMDLSLGSSGEIFIRLNGSTGQVNMTIDNNTTVSVGGDLTANVSGDADITATNATIESQSKSTVKGSVVDVIADSVNLGGSAGMGVARVGDPVTVATSTGPASGTITSGSTKVKST
jgi:hypothetical protein